MQDPKNADAVAEIATVTGHKAASQDGACRNFSRSISGRPRTTAWSATSWSVDALMKKIGAIKPGKEPATYDKLVDPSVWKDANAMVK